MKKNVKIPVNTELDKYAKELRKNMTTEEKIVWYQILKGRVPKFHRQKIIGNYIADFYCPQLKLIIEIDGVQHYFEETSNYDAKRTEYFESLGFYVLRFDNSDVKKDTEEVRMIIDNVCNAREKGVELLPDYR
ncbi:MAG: endonuclease domain-containing protein [Ruminococcaceae bacterium]|nr:endonuclease domain-containing protein [Oscillospiraceae bacterium]